MVWVGLTTLTVNFVRTRLICELFWESRARLGGAGRAIFCCKRSR